jgi:hypothetical protein
MRALNRVGPLVARRWPSLKADDLLAAAVKRVGAEDFGDDSFREGLDRLLDSAREEAGHHWLGRVMLQQSIDGFLQNRLKLYRHRAAHPEVAQVPVERPIFIVGLPRTGTTVLFNLLACDPSNRVPSHWETQWPDPPPRRETYDTDPRIAEAVTYFGHMDKLAPTLQAIHPVGALLPQECLPILGHAFLGPQFHVAHDVPTYNDWVVQQSHAPAYRFHRHFLQHLGSRFAGERWALKSPAHIGLIDDLLREYPDARIIHTHRDPAKAMPSLGSLIYTVRGLASDSVNPQHVGRQQMDMWGAALDRSVEARRKHADKGAQFFDLQFEEIVADPVAALGRAYAHFDIPFRDDVESRMRRFMTDNPRDKHGHHRYELADFGMELGEIRERFAEYCEAFGVKLVV